MSDRLFSQVVKEMIETSNLKVDTIESILGKKRESIISWVDVEKTNHKSPLQSLKMTAFSQLFLLFQSEHISEFKNLTTGSKQVFTLKLVKDDSSLKELAKKIGLTNELVSRHIRGSRLSSRAEKLLLDYVESFQIHTPHDQKQTQSITYNRRKDDVLGDSVKKPSVKEDQFYEDFAPLLVTQLQSAGKLLHKFMFEHSNPETRRLLRDAIGDEHFENLRIAIIAMGSATNFKAVLRDQPDLAKLNPQFSHISKGY